MVPPDQSGAIPNIPGPTSHQPDILPTPANLTLDQHTATTDGPNPAAPVLPEVDFDGVNAPHLNPAPGNGAATPVDVFPQSNPCIDVKDEPAWMKKRRILDYFRNTFKLGNLSEVIEHWYELERLLDFQDVVSVSIQFP